MINKELFRNIQSKRKVLISGCGWFVGKISLRYISRHSCTSGILDEKDFEFEEDNLKEQKQYLSFSNSLSLILKNLENGEQEIYEFKNLKKLGIYRGRLNPEDLTLTNSFEEIPRFCINHNEYEDEEYYLECQKYWTGIYGQFSFEEGEKVDFKKFDIDIKKIDTGFTFYEWVCEVKYQGKKREKGNIKTSQIKKRLKVKT